MKKLLSFIFSITFVVVFFAMANAQISVSSASYFQEIYNSANGQSIKLLNNINFSDNIGGTPQCNYSGFSIDGNGKTLFGNSVANLYFYRSGDVIIKNLNLYGMKNLSGSGGGIYFFGHAALTKLIFEGEKISFNNNESTQHNGGALYVYYSNADFNSLISSFTNNKSRYYGGALYANGSGKSVNFYNDAYFEGNSTYGGGGGVISDNGGTVNFQGANTTFIKNSANGYVDSNNMNLGGGAAYAVYYGKINFTGGKVVFSSNSSNNGYGGAVGGRMNAYIHFSNDITEFKWNSANYGGGLGLLNHQGYSSKAEFIGGNISFVGNTATNNGGAIYVGGVSGESKVTFSSSNVSFINNSAKNGSTIYVDENNQVIFNNSTVTFTNNSGTSIYSSNSDNVVFNGGKVIFSSYTNTIGSFVNDWSKITFNPDVVEFSYNNSTNGLKINEFDKFFQYKVRAIGNKSQNGGFLYFDSVSKKFKANMEMINNSANNGGALFIAGSENNSNHGVADVEFTNSEVKFIDNFAYNSGGAIYISSANSSVNFVNSDVHFINNSLENTDTENKGGAIYADSAKVSFDSSNVTFVGNSAYYGASLYLYKATATFSGDKTIFSSNTAVVVGAGISMQYSVLNVNNDFIDFSENSAIGGAGFSASGWSQIVFNNKIVKFMNNRARSGAGIDLLQSKMNFKAEEIKFIGNYASSEGGAVTMSGDAFGVLNAAKIEFLKNSTNSRGGAMSVGLSQLIINSTSTEFVSNTAAQYGGALLIEAATVTFSGTKMSFVENTAKEGGAVYVKDTNVYTYRASPVPNPAVLIGISTFTSTVIFNTKETVFSQNSAESNGGALFLTNNTDMKFQDSKVEFINNKAGEYGGAIYASTNSVINFIDSDVYFISNTAKLGSAIYAVNGASVNFNNGDIIFSNNASEEFYETFYTGVYTYYRGGSIFAAGSFGGMAQRATVINFSGSNNVDFINHSNAENTFVQGGALFAGGAVGSGNFTGTGGLEINFNSVKNINISNNLFTRSLHGGSFFIAGTLNTHYFAPSQWSDSNDQNLSGEVKINFNDIKKLTIQGNGSVSSQPGNFMLDLKGGAFFVSGALSSGGSGGKGGVLEHITNNGNAFMNFNNIELLEMLDNKLSAKVYMGYFAVVQGGALFAGGAIATCGDVVYNATATVTFNSIKTMNVNNNSVNLNGGITSNSLVQGGGIFAGGVIASPAGGMSTNNASSGTVIMNFNAIEALNFIANKATADTVYSAVGQGGGIFAGGVIGGGSAGSYPGRNYASSGTVIMNFENINRMNIRNNIVYGADGAQGAGIHVVGALGGCSNFGKAFVKIENTNISFEGNKAYNSKTIWYFDESYNSLSSTTFSCENSQGGALFAAGTSAGAVEGRVEILFKNSKISFIGNSAAYGGAIYIAGNEGTGISGSATIDFIDSDVYFISNTAKLGSAIYAVNGASVNFTGGSLTLQGNVSTEGDGAAFYVDATSTITMTGVALTMVNNYSAGFGGASYFAEDSGMKFDKAQTFSGNESGEGGGAIAAMENAKLEFNNIETNFNGNSANQGGALYSYLADIVFDGGEVNFDNNYAVNGGGAIYAIDDIIFRGINAGFSNNNAGSGKGGAIFSEDTVAKFQNAAMLFYNNRTLSDGGAIYAGDNSSIDLGGKATFEGNIAGGKGGAIYLSGDLTAKGTLARRSTMTISADSGDIIFRNNIAAGVPNDIYVDSNSALTLTGAYTIRLEGGLLTSTNAAAINITKSGIGTLELGGTNEVWGSFDISAGDIRFLNNATFAGKELKLENGNKLDMTNSTINTISVDTFVSTTETGFDIFSNNTNDKVYAASATVAGNIKLNFGVGIYNNNVYELIVTSNTSDLYTNIISSSSNNSDIVFNFDTSESGKYKLAINGFHKVNFSSLADFIPSELSDNQKEVLNALNEAVVTASPNSEIIDIVNMVLTQGATQQLNLLASGSGYMIANAIRATALDSDSRNLYDRINNKRGKSGIWAQVTGASIKHDADKESVSEYKDNMVGMMFGYDKQTSEKVKIGIYGKYNSHDIDQGIGGSADISNVGLGAYIGYEEQAWELKAMLGGSYDSYETKRTITGLTANGDFNSITIGADIEGAFKISLSDKFKLKPYAGLEAKNVNYESFTEKGAGAMNLAVSGDNYVRSAARAGVGIEYREEVWSLYVKGEGKYIITGTESEIEAALAGIGKKIKSKGYEEDAAEFGIGLGGEVKVYKGLNIFVNGNYEGSGKMSNIGGNAGLRYNFR